MQDLTVKTLPRFHFGDPEVCTYCGSWQHLQIEHVIPVSYFYLDRRKLKRQFGMTTHACASCNGSLGAKVFWQFHERYDCAQKSIRRKTKKHYRMAAWTEDELDDVDYSLRAFIIQEQNKRIHSVSRMDWDGSAPMLKMKDVIAEQVTAEGDSFVTEFMSHWLNRN